LEGFKVNLDKILYEKTNDIEVKRVLMQTHLKKVKKMENCPLKRRLLYNMESKIKDDPTSNEERQLHESYQFVLREYEARHKVSKLLTPQSSVRRRAKSASSQHTSVYRGEKDFYEKVCEGLPNGESFNAIDDSLCVGLDGLLLTK
jgi:hypothetical protein